MTTWLILWLFTSEMLRYCDCRPQGGKSESMYKCFLVSCLDVCFNCMRCRYPLELAKPAVEVSAYLCLKFVVGFLSDKS